MLVLSGNHGTVHPTSDVMMPSRPLYMQLSNSSVWRLSSPTPAWMDSIHYREIPHGNFMLKPWLKPVYRGFFSDHPRIKYVYPYTSRTKVWCAFIITVCSVSKHSKGWENIISRKLYHDINYLSAITIDTAPIVSQQLHDLVVDSDLHETTQIDVNTGSGKNIFCGNLFKSIYRLTIYTCNLVSITWHIMKTIL